MRTAVLYLRSSKDRSDVSISAQRRALQDLAKAKNLPIVSEFADAVESGKDDQRPAYQAMLRELATKSRPWNVILAYDTSRIARRTYIAQTLQHEAKKRGVSILYVKVPEADPITTVILQNVLQAMDEVHSLMSREKGLAGMGENIRRGFRAGGRAPTGYRLEHIATGAIREGEAVQKSRLVPNEKAPAIAAYLKARAIGENGAAAARRLRLELSRSTLVDIEWNALTYAGHTVWNMRRAKDSQEDGSRRPRAEWMMQRGTHEALISDDEAETLLSRLESLNSQWAARRANTSRYLLSGLLVSPAGGVWHGDGKGCYKETKTGRRVSSNAIESQVLELLARDFSKPAIVKAFTREARKIQAELEDSRELDQAKSALAAIEKTARRLTDLLEQTTEPAPILRRLEALELERRATAERMMRAEDASQRIATLERITERDVAALLRKISADLAELHRDSLKDVLQLWLERVELDPTTRQGRLIYRLCLTGDKLASPRRPELNPGILTVCSAPFMLVRSRTSPAAAGWR
jgi:site-specific DNA recombinase